MRGTDNANTVVPDAAGVAATPAEVATALTDIHLDHLLAVDYDPASKPGTSTALLNELIENDAGISRYTANALEQAPSGSGGDATEAKQDQLIAAVITNAAGADVAADIIASKTAIDAIPTTAMRGTDSALLASGVPTNFSSMGIESDGHVHADLKEWLGAAPAILNAGLVQSDLQRIINSTNPVQSLRAWLDSIIGGVAGSGTTTTIVDTSLTEIDDYWNGAMILFTNGDHIDMARNVTDFDAATDTLTFTPALPANVVNGDAYRLFPGWGFAATRAEVATTLTDIHLDHLLAVDYDPASKPGTSTALLNELIESDAGVSRYTANALEQGPAGGGGGDATEAKQDLLIAAVITNAAGDDVAADIIAMKTETALIVADTNELQTDWLNGGRLDQILDIIAADTTTDLPALINALDDVTSSEVRTQVDAALQAIGLNRLLSVAVTGAQVQDNSVFARLVSKEILADWDDYDNTTDSLQAIRDNQAGGGDATEAKQDLLIAAVITNAAGADVAADIIAVKTVVDAIPTTAMRGTDNANIVVPDAAGVAATPAEVATALTDIHLDHLLAVDYDPASKPGTSTALLNELVESDAGVSRYTANALEQAAGGGDATEAKQDLLIAAVITNAAGADVAADIIALKAETVLIVADTNELQSDDVPGLIGTLDSVVDTVKAETVLILADTAELQSDDVPGLIATLDNVVDTVKAETALIVADTNELQVDDVPGLIAALNDVDGAEILTQVNSALNASIAELGVASPTATPSLRTGLMLLYMMLRNKRDTTASSDEIHNSAGTVIADAVVSDDAVIFTKTKYT